MEKQISKRLKRLERAAEKDIFQNAWSFAAAYYLGGANDVSKCPQALAKALGYPGLQHLCQGLANLIKGKSSDVQTRANRAQRKLLAMVHLDADRANPIEVKDAIDRIVRTLPEDWRAVIKSGYRESCEAEARANQILSILNPIIKDQGQSAKHQPAPA